MNIDIFSTITQFALTADEIMRVTWFIGIALLVIGATIGVAKIGYSLVFNNGDPDTKKRAVKQGAMIIMGAVVIGLMIPFIGWLMGLLLG